MKESDRSLLFDVLFGLLHQYEIQYDEALRFIHRYGKPFPSDYAAVSLALCKIDTAKEIISRLTLFLDTLDLE